jgi:rhodanese-related sulfurtransferase
VVIYGKTANRSEVARLMLQARGYEAHVMEGGSEAWVAQGLHHPRRPARPRRLTL